MQIFCTGKDEKSSMFEQTGLGLSNSNFDMNKLIALRFYISLGHLEAFCELGARSQCIESIYLNC